MKVIIVDDEEKGRESLRKLIVKYSPGISVAATAGNIREAQELISQHKPEAVFLDVEMPGGSGFTLLDHFPARDFKVIFVTAFEQYGIRAVKQQAFDYLMKPIDIDELVLVLDKLKASGKHLDPTEGDAMSAVSREQRLDINSRLPIPVKDGIFFLVVGDIVRIDSEAGYCTFHTVERKKYVVAKNLKEYEDLLPEKDFFRIHKSHLINVKKAKKYIRTDGNFLEMEDGALVEISRRKKDEFLKLMNAL